MVVDAYRDTGTNIQWGVGRGRALKSRSFYRDLGANKIENMSDKRLKKKRVTILATVLPLFQSLNFR